MKVYRRLNFSLLPWVRSLISPTDGGWSILCLAETMIACDDAIAADRKRTTLYEYKVERDED